MSSRLRIIILLVSVVFFIPKTFACEGPVGKSVGQCAPNFQVQNLNGKTFELSQMKGKVVLVNFWATWCKPCIVEMPSMQKIYSTLKKNNVELWAISIDNNTKEIKNFLDKDLDEHLSFPIFFDQDKKVSSAFGTYQVPETYVIDKTGRITDKIIGIRDWDDSITVNYLKLLAK